MAITFAESNKADEIFPGLWLGSYLAAEDEAFLKGRGIKAVFNATKNLPFVESVPHKYRIPVDDNLQPEEIRNMELWSTKFVPLIINEWHQGPVLVHCHAGMQRSAAAIAMVLISIMHLDADTAIKYIQMKRPIAFRPSANFRAAILGFQRTQEAEWLKTAKRNGGG